MKKLPFLSGLVLLVLFTSCKPEEVSVADYRDGVFILNEGNFQSANGSIDFLFRNGDSLQSNVFANINNRPLGDVVQSMTQVGDELYVVVNNSQKIEVLNATDFTSVGAITGFTSPRVLQAVSDEKAYVTDLFSGKLSIVNLKSRTITGTINLPGGSEGMLFYNGVVYVGNASPYLYLLNPNSDQIIDSIAVAAGGNSLVLDPNNKIWLLSSGDYFTGAAGGLARINPATKTVEQSFDFTADDFPGDLRLTRDKTALLYLNGGLFKMGLTDNELPATAYVPANGRSFNALGVDPVTGEVFVGDAKDYVQRGTIFRYPASSNVAIDSFQTGLIPGDFFFTQP